jgi:hypothetical protein
LFDSAHHTNYSECLSSGAVLGALEKALAQRIEVGLKKTK